MIVMRQPWNYSVINFSTDVEKLYYICAKVF